MKLVPNSAEIKVVAIASVAEPVTINASVTLDDGSVHAVVVPAHAIAGDYIKLAVDGTVPASVSVEDGSFLDKNTVAIDYSVVG